MFSGFGDSFGQDVFKDKNATNVPKSGRVNLDYENILPDRTKAPERAQMRTPGATSGLRPLGKGYIPVTIGLIEKSNTDGAFATPGEMHIGGRDVALVRVVGWVIEGSVSEQSGEFSFKINDGSSNQSGVEVICSTLTQHASWIKEFLNDIIQKAIPTNGVLESQIAVTGIIGLTPTGTACIRSEHIRLAEDVESAFYHRISVAKNILVKEEMTDVRKAPGVGSSYETEPKTNTMDKAAILAQSDDIFTKIDFDMSNELECLVAKTIFYLRKSSSTATKDLIYACCEMSSKSEQDIEAVLHAKLSSCALMSCTSRDYEDGDELPSHLYFLVDDD